MFSKFKKVLVSLALASSLALAPMNVSAANEGPIEGSASADPAVNKAGEAVQVPVYLTGTASAPQYVIEVSPSITINLDSNATSAYDLNSADDGHDGIYLKLTTAVDFEDKNLRVTPSFVALDGGTPIELEAEGNKTDNTHNLSGLGIDNNLLRFGTYIDNTFTTGSDSVAFAESDKNSIKSVPTDVDAAKSAAIRQAMPNEIEGKGNVQIKANQQIGNVTFACEFVAQ